MDTDDGTGSGPCSLLKYPLQTMEEEADPARSRSIDCKKGSNNTNYFDSHLKTIEVLCQLSCWRKDPPTPIDLGCAKNMGTH